MPGGFGTQSVFVGDVAAAVRDRLAGVGVDRAYIFFSLADVRVLVKNPPADRFIAFQPTRLPVNQGIAAGAGAAYTEFDSTWDFHVCCRLGTDQQFRSTRFVEDASLGLAALVRNVSAALHIRTLTADDATGPAVSQTPSPLIEPSRLIDITFHDREPAPGWGWAVVTASLPFYADLTE